MSLEIDGVWKSGVWATTVWADDVWQEGLAAPSFTGTIPTLTETTDLSTYFSYATSYSIAPAVESGWSFDTVTGVLTLDDVEGTFSGYVITGTNASGSADSNSFNVEIAADAEEDQSTGGFWFAYESEMLRRNAELKKKAKKRKKAKKIEDDLHQALALEQIKIQEEEARDIELDMLSKLVSEHRQEIEKTQNDKVIRAVNRALLQTNFSAKEALERELRTVREEEMFLIQAAQILLSQ